MQMTDAGTLTRVSSALISDIVGKSVMGTWLLGGTKQNMWTTNAVAREIHEHGWEGQIIIFNESTSGLRKLSKVESDHPSCSEMSSGALKYPDSK